MLDIQKGISRITVLQRLLSSEIFNGNLVVSLAECSGVSKPPEYTFVNQIYHNSI